MPWKQNGHWRCRVKGADGKWRKVWLEGVRTRKDAEREEADRQRKAQRQREGLEPLAMDCKWTVGRLLSWWLDEYRANRRQEHDRFRNHFEASELAQLPVVGMTAAQIEA